MNDVQELQRAARELHPSGPKIRKYRIEDLANQLGWPIPRAYTAAKAAEEMGKAWSPEEYENK